MTTLINSYIHNFRTNKYILKAFWFTVSHPSFKEEIY